MSQAGSAPSDLIVVGNSSDDPFAIDVAYAMGQSEDIADLISMKSFANSEFCPRFISDEQDFANIGNKLQGKKVVQVCAGNMHSLVLTESGEVYSFGYGGFGNLGHGDTVTQTLPKLVEAMQDKRVVHVSAGAGHSLLMLESGEVLECGRSSRDNTYHVLVPESVANAIVASPTVVRAIDL